MNQNHIPYFRGTDYWALIIGGSSGMGWATAKKLAQEGMQLCILYRDPKVIEKEFLLRVAALREVTGVTIHTINTNALLPEARNEAIESLRTVMGDKGRLRVLLHSIAKGNLKPLALPPTRLPFSLENFMEQYGISNQLLAAALFQLYQPESNLSPQREILSEEDFRLTIHAMATNLLEWTNALLQAGLFAEDARIIAITSEGSSKVWPGYAAVSAAKATLENLARCMAVELAPSGLRTNLIQAGVTDTASLRMIPGSETIKAQSVLRNPFKRLTRAEDVANAIYLLTTREAAWINGALLHVDGGEHCC
jgi:enoyl-[acyl-carrier protein] reductase III